MAKILFLPSSVDCDPTELAVPARLLASRGHALVIATPDGRPPSADARVLTGRGFGILAPVLGASRSAQAAWQELEASQPWRETQSVHAVRATDFDALVFIGGHAPAMRTYLEDVQVQALASEAFAANRRVAAVCHGLIPLARAKKADGRSVLHGHRTTALTRRQELLAWNLTRAWLGDYYRTYPTPVQDEVTAALAGPNDFLEGPLPLFRDTETNLSSGFVVEDGRLITARWPGDVNRFAHAIEDALRRDAREGVADPRP